MLAARVDQENVVHDQQTAAAAKPLNQTLRGHTAKTPGNKAPKTPFKVPLNDENTTVRAGKSVLKTNGKSGLIEGQKGLTFNKSAFVTPAGPRNRPALGLKTTNAKANAFLTPGPQKAEKSPTKTISPRLRRAKVKVLQSEPITQKAEDEELEIEYMAPRGKPLPDYPSDDEFGPNKTFPQLAPENLTRGMFSTYLNPVDHNGISLGEKEKAERKVEFDKRVDEQLKKHVEDSLADVERSVMEDLGLAPKRSANPSSQSTAFKSSIPGTLITKSAASALSRPAKIPSYAAATNASKTRAPGMLNIRKSREVPLPSTDPSASRFATASAASRSTIGYSQGRATSQKFRTPSAAIFKDETNHQRSTSQASTASAYSSSLGDFQTRAKDVVEQLRLQDLDLDEQNDGFYQSTGTVEDEYADFQLTVPAAE